MRENMRWPWWFSLLTLGLDISIVIALWAALGDTAALLGIFLTLGFSAFFYYFSSLSIRTKDETLYIGRAHISRDFLKNPEALEPERMTHYLREGFTTRAFYAVRFWVKTGIKIEIDDPRDPNVLWIVSTKRPKELQDWINA